MLSPELKEYIDWQDDKLKALHGYSHDQRTRLLARTVKLAEESGELAEAALAWCSFQRSEKLEGKAMKLPDEIADVIIVALLIAKTADVDVDAALRDKIAVIRERFADKQPA
ncbi:hypothetical protein ACFL26_01345 [Patescibacteria group bacterium]